ncbi:unnamed protein product [Hymenolepis diminuta]|uniref:glycerol kinase n=2 Tax=Hymenolepis diminuta TaxID=6216 RepID=A0A0R3SPV4_HYMDI|nr:unnamed protein product [Hymenolepis diminuta]
MLQRSLRVGPGWALRSLRRNFFFPPSRSKEKDLIGVIDQGTSSTRFVVFNAATGELVCTHQVPIGREHPHLGWVQQSPNQIYHSAIKCMNDAVATLKTRWISPERISVVGITNQRETTIAWNSKTGKPVCPAIVWSDNRTSECIQNLIKKNKDNRFAFQKLTGLPIDSYFSAMKIHWMLHNYCEVMGTYTRDKLKVGTVDSWLIYKLTGGQHLTDYTNASRTNLFNINSCKFDGDLCDAYELSDCILPRVITSAEVYGKINDRNCRLYGTRLGGVLGDQQAALVGQTWEPNPEHQMSKVKVTFGTGAFILWDIGKSPHFNSYGLLTTIAHKMGPEANVHYALEGSIACSGATMDWIQNKLGMFYDHASGSKLAEEALKRRESHEDACYLIPAFSGLLCPYWKEDAKSVLVGFDEDCTKGDVIAAGYRSSAYQTHAVLQAACEGNNGEKWELPKQISVDGGLSRSPVLMQSLADITGASIYRPNNSEVITALGAAIASAISVGIDPSKLTELRKYSTNEEIEANTFKPRVDKKIRQRWIQGYENAVKLSLN